MANILKVTTPGSGYDNNNIKNNPAPNNGMQIQNPVDPTKVTRSDNRTDSGDNQGGKLSLNYESNFENFIQQIKEAPELARAFAELLLHGADSLSGSGIQEDFAMELAEFLQLMDINQEAAPAFLKEQLRSASKFRNGFFDLLRLAMSETTSVELKAEILEFVKKYSDLSSGGHILENIKNTLEEMLPYMLRQSRGNLEQMLSQMDWNALNGEIGSNGEILKKNIMPLLGRYISGTHDMGKIRDLISLLTFHISRYENSDLEGVVQSFKRLLGYQGFKKYFGDLTQEQFKDALINMDFEKESGKTLWTEKFYSLLQKGIGGGAGIEHIGAFESMMYSVLLNESVYMPLLHMMFPMNLSGNMMFSELWVDPDANDSQSQNPEEQATKMLIKFDIKGLGHFEVILLHHREKLNLHIYYPEKLAVAELVMHKEIDRIIQTNQLNMDALYLEKGENPRKLTDIFPKIMNKRSTVNVRI